MSRSELLTEIERLRSRMNDLAASGAEFTELLEVSQQLDLLIVEYHKAAMWDIPHGIIPEVSTIN